MDAPKFVGLDPTVTRIAVGDTPAGWHGYADLLRGRMAELPREGSPEGYPLSVGSASDLSLQRIEQEQPAAADLLHLCAFLAPDDIPITVLQAGGVSAWRHADRRRRPPLP